jgi:hypothetical protein
MKQYIRWSVLCGVLMMGILVAAGVGGAVGCGATGASLVWTPRAILITAVGRRRRLKIQRQQKISR